MRSATVLFLVALFAANNVYGSSANGPRLTGSHRVSNVFNNPDGSLTFDYEVKVKNTGLAPQADNPGPEALTYLPPGVLSIRPAGNGQVFDVISAAGLPVQLAWSGALLPGEEAVIKVEVTVQKNPIQGSSNAIGSWWSSYLFSDTDFSGDNETINLTSDAVAAP